MERYQTLVDRSPKAIEELKEKLARIKGEVFQTEAAKRTRDFIMNHFKPLFDTPLTFRAYGIGDKLDRVLKETEERGDLIEQ